MSFPELKRRENSFTTFTDLKRLAENKLSSIDDLTLDILDGVSKDFAYLNLLQTELAEIRERIPKMINSLSLVPRPSSNPGVLAVDLDGVLIIRDTLLGSIPWHYWMIKKNRENHLQELEWHANYLEKLILHFPHRSAEDPAMVNDLFESYRNAGQKVVILTSRKHSLGIFKIVEACRISVPEQDYIFTFSQPKRPALLEWIRNNFDPRQNIEIQFIDDQEPNIQNLNLCKTVDDLVLECFFFTNRLQSEPWPQHHLEKMACQLFGIVNSWPEIPSLEEPNDPTLLDTIKLTWNIDTFDENTLYKLFLNHLPGLK